MAEASWPGHGWLGKEVVEAQKERERERDSRRAGESRRQD